MKQMNWYRIVLAFLTFTILNGCVVARKPTKKVEPITTPISTSTMKTHQSTLIIESTQSLIPLQSGSTPSPLPEPLVTTNLHALLPFTDTPSPTRLILPSYTITPSPTRAYTSLVIRTPYSTLTANPISLGKIAILDWKNANILTMKPDGSDFKKLAEGMKFSYSLTWSPDGHWIAFDGDFWQWDERKSEIYIVRIDGSELKRLTFAPGEKVELSWSPDGQYILYVTDNGRDQNSGEIVRYKVDGSDIRFLTSSPFSESYPAWSPDGKKIAFLYPFEDKPTSWQYPCTSLMVMDPDGSNRKMVTDFPAGIGKISWSPDSTRITFSSCNNGCGQIYDINSDGSDLRRLTNISDCAENPSWSPDGKNIIFTTSDTNGVNTSIHLMNADGTEIDQIQTDQLLAPHDIAWAPVPALQVGITYRITESGANLNLRDAHSLKSPVLNIMKEGDSVTVLEGPVDVEGYYWWRMRTADGVEGWAVDWLGWYAPVSAKATPAP